MCIREIRAARGGRRVAAPGRCSQRQHQVQEVIAALYAGGPGALLHVRGLGAVLGRPVHVYRDGRRVAECGKRNGLAPLELEYTEGHWAPRAGGSGLASRSGDCLFEALAAQTGIGARALRLLSARHLRRTRPRVDADALGMAGGARYNGRSPGDAGQLLDMSQRGQNQFGRSGHPRGHVFDRNATGPTESIENYCRYKSYCTGFMSREDQNLVAHYAFNTRAAVDMYYALNNGSSKEAAKISRSEIDYHPLPLIMRWESGNIRDPEEFRMLTLVGQHFLNRENDPAADVFVLTFYPMV